MSGLLFTDFQAYAKQLSIKNKDVLHDDINNVAFIKLFSRDELNKITTSGSTMLVVVTMFTGKAIGSPDQSQLMQHASLMFLKRVSPNSGDPSSDIETAQQIAMEVMFQYYAKMKKDQRDDDCGVLQYLVSDQMIFTPVEGPVIEDHYGWEMIIPFGADAPGYDGTKWNA